jgi:CHAD domain-containing protein
MAFRLKPGEPLDKCARRIVRDQIDKALGSLTGLRANDAEKAIHDARRRFKKVRAVLRMARAGLGPKRTARETQRFRDAARPLSDVRDAEVLADAFEELVKRFDPIGHVTTVDLIRTSLANRKRNAWRRILDDEPTIATVIESIQKERRRVKRWEFDDDDWSILKKGLARIYRKGYRASRIASIDPTDENLHDWRKRIKDLDYLLEILRPIRPDSIGEDAETTSQLAEALGDDHDLAVLRHALTEPEIATQAGAEIGAILTLIDVRRSELQHAARLLGREVTIEKPKVFVKRMREYWRAWRSENQPPTTTETERDRQAAP